MKTSIKKAGDTTIVDMTGKIDFETQESFRADLARLVDPSKTDSVPKKIIFNLEKLEFVGSSGISTFIQTLKEFSSQTQAKPRYCNVRSEFKRVIKAFDEDEMFEFHDNEEKAKKSFDQ